MGALRAPTRGSGGMPPPGEFCRPEIVSGSIEQELHELCKRLASHSRRTRLKADSHYRRNVTCTKRNVCADYVTFCRSHCSHAIRLFHVN